jgi:hypothetical protein
MRVVVLATTLILLSSLAISQTAALTDAQLRQRIIQQSLSSYSGNCPCPFNVDRAGRRCGGRSAWSRAGGAQPVCYPDEISDEQVRQYRARYGNPAR